MIPFSSPKADNVPLGCVPVHFRRRPEPTECQIMKANRADIGTKV